MRLLILEKDPPHKDPRKPKRLCAKKSWLFGNVLEEVLLDKKKP